MQFLKYVLATIVGIFLFYILFFFLFMGIGSMFSSSEGTSEVKEGTVLKLDLDGKFTDLKKPEDPFTGILGDEINYISIRELQTSLKNAALDPKIKGISISINDPSMGFAELEEVRSALLNFKKSGKFIYTYGDYLSEKAILLCAVADSAFIHPEGSVEFNGLSSEITYFQGTLEKLGIEPIIFRVGEYKSAVEPYFRKDMSEASKEQIKSYLGSISHKVYSNFAQDKNWALASVDSLLNKAPIFTSDEALKYDLVQAVAYADQYEDAIKNKLGVKKVEYATLSTYSKAKKLIKESTSSDRVAVIVSEGEIVDGNGGEGFIAAEEFIKEIKRARKDKKVKAIVLRINSPGGSAMASDKMWREIQLTKKEKPVFASMGNVAASGGYYMAMGCDTIVAHPTTITGSIGIFGVMLNFQNFMNDKLGVTFDEVSTHTYSNSPSSVKKMTEVEKQSIQNMINKGYESFTTKAAQGRKMDLNELKSLAGGRVWTGEQAKENGLVDILGDLDTAIELAAKKAGIKDYQVKYYPYPKSDFDRLIEKFTKSGSEAQLIEKLGEFGPIYKTIKGLSKMDLVQARMFEVPEIR